MDPVTLHRRTVAEWTARVAAVGEDQWTLPTPCSEWDVRALVNHVTGEDLWTVPLLEGRTIAEVGDSLDGDLLGDHPVDAALRAASQAVAGVEQHPIEGAIVHLSYGDEDAGEYLMQLSADHLVHGWDLARATDGDVRLDPELVASVTAWFAEREELYRAAGIIGPRPDSDSADPQSRLLTGFGRRG